MKLLKLLSLLPLLFAVSCASSGTGKGVEPPKTNPKFTISLKNDKVNWNSMDDVREALGSKVKISGTTVDLMGGKISGKKLKKPSNSQSESAVGVKVKIKDFTLKNGEVDSIPGGVICYEKNPTFQNLIFTGVSEDYVSNIKDSSDGFKILNCKFYNNEKGDKSAQANGAVNLLIRDSYFSGGITGVRIGESSSKRRGSARIESSTFENVSTALNIDGKTKVYTKNIVLKNVKDPYVVKSGSEIINE